MRTKILVFRENPPLPSLPGSVLLRSDSRHPSSDITLLCLCLYLYLYLYLYFCFCLSL
jgi:hypothetical protein